MLPRFAADITGKRAIKSLSRVSPGFPESLGFRLAVEAKDSMLRDSLAAGESGIVPSDTDFPEFPRFANV